MITRQELHTSVTQTLDKVEQAVSSTPVSLMRGQNLINVTSDGVTPFNVLNIKGRTLVNLLGRDGNCEDASKWLDYQSTHALDSTNRVYGSNGMKVTIATGYTEGDLNRSLTLTGGKYYIILGDVKNGNATNAKLIYGSTPSIQSVSDTNNFNPVYIKINPVSTITTNLNMTVIGSAGQYAYFDGIRVYEISQAEYNALGTTLTDINAIAAKYPYVDDMKGLNNPYLNVYASDNTTIKDYVYFQTALRSNVDQSVYDEINVSNGQFVKTNRFAELVLDGTLGYVHSAGLTGYKEIKVTVPNSTSYTSTVVKYDGKVMKDRGAGSPTGADQVQLDTNGMLYLEIGSSDSGWGDSYTPTAQEIQAYFYGWRMYALGDATMSPYTSGTKVWRDVATMDSNNATQTLPATYAPSNVKWTPYKLLYQLATPTQEVVTTEGAVPTLSQGNNQVELGEAVVVRERIIPVLANSYYNINDSSAGAFTKYRPDKILHVEKNGSIDPKWVIDSGTTYGKSRSYISPSNYDQTASYSVTYIAQPYQFSSSILSLDGSYESNLRKDVDRNTANISDLFEQTTMLMNTKANKQQGQWISPTLLNGWVNRNTGNDAPVGYYKNEFGDVRIRGIVNGGTAGSNIFYLPVGYRPSKNVYLPIASSNAGTIVNGYCSVAPDGTVFISSNVGVTWVEIDNSFRAEQ